MTKTKRSKLYQHPAIQLGEFIKNQRIGAGLTLRIFCQKTKIPPCIQSELERGIGDHLTVNRYHKISETCCGLNEDYIFKNLVKQVENSSILENRDLYEKEELYPAFPNPKIWTEEVFKKWGKMVDEMLKPKWEGKQRRKIYNKVVRQLNYYR